MKVTDKSRNKIVKPTRGKKVLATLLRGGKIKGRTQNWLQFTRGAA